MSDQATGITAYGYEQCDSCHGFHHRDEMRGPYCKWCDREIGGEG